MTQPRKSRLSVSALTSLRTELRELASARKERLARDARLADSLRTPFVRNSPPPAGNLSRRALSRLSDTLRVL